MWEAAVREIQDADMITTAHVRRVLARLFLAFSEGTCSEPPYSEHFLLTFKQPQVDSEMLSDNLFQPATLSSDPFSSTFEGVLKSGGHLYGFP